MQPKALTKLIGFFAFLTLAAAATVAAWGYDATSTGRRGRGLETLWHGLLSLLGQEEDATSDMIWVGRGIALVGLALVALYAVRRIRAATPDGAPAAASPQHAPAQQFPPAQPTAQPTAQPQVQWSAGGPQPAPVPQPSWGAVTSGPTPLPPIPQAPQGAQAPRAPQQDGPAQDTSTTRAVIIPPLPPNWGRD